VRGYAIRLRQSTARIKGEYKLDEWGVWSFSEDKVKGQVAATVENGAAFSEQVYSMEVRCLFGSMFMALIKNATCKEACQSLLTNITPAIMTKKAERSASAYLLSLYVFFPNTLAARFWSTGLSVRATTANV
jgi:alpha-L-arabinofuranosidase